MRPQPVPAAPLEQAAAWFSIHRSGAIDADEMERFDEWLAREATHLDAYRSVERAWTLAAAVAQDPAILATREADKHRYRAVPALRRMWAVAAGVAVVASLGWLAHAVDGGNLFDRPRVAGTYDNAVGQRTRMRLSDGSIVTLDTDSQVRVRRMDRERRIELVRGRAFFDVARDPSRPFFVVARNKVVRAIGTAFSVRIDDRAHDVSVALVEGKVAVANVPGLLGRERIVELTPGAKLDAHDDGQWSVGRFERRDETSWIQGRLVFSDMLVGQAITEMNRYSERKIVMKGSDTPDQSIVGVFRTGDVDALAKAITLSGSAHVVSTDADSITLEKDPTDRTGT